MKTLAILSQKGGTGKTNTAVNLAVASHLAGHRTAVIDLDPQASAAKWGDRRDGDSPYHRHLTAERKPIGEIYVASRLDPLSQARVFPRRLRGLIHRAFSESHFRGNYGRFFRESAHPPPSRQPPLDDPLRSRVSVGLTKHLSPVSEGQKPP